MGFFRAFQLWVVIAPWEAALRVRLGRRAGVLSPGMHLRLPFLDRIFVQSVRVRTIADTGQTMATRDGSVLTLSVAITYAIEDIEKLYMSVSNPEVTLLLQLQGAIAETVANADRGQLTPKKVQESAARKIQAADWGLGQVQVMVTTFAFVKVLRLINYEFRTTSQANELEPIQF
jgi:regulator of protease activity HflC (stomatin/prohibitin superfamily)